MTAPAADGQGWRPISCAPELTRLALLCAPIGLALYGAYRLIVG